MHLALMEKKLPEYVHLARNIFFPNCLTFGSSYTSKAEFQVDLDLVLRYKKNNPF